MALILAAGLWPGLGVGAARGQVSGVELDIKAEHLGLGGYIRRGSWTPVRLELFNQSAEPIEVVCRWILRDDDKDRVVAERTATLASQRDERVWLYANPPLDSSPVDVWTFQVVDKQSNQLLTQQQVQIPQTTFIEPKVNMIGVCGFASLGLSAFDRWSSQHEPMQRVEGLNLETLPDRWYGLSALTALVWSPEEGGNPDSIAFTEPMRGALREWVYRGGHLVIVLPPAGQTWTSGELKDMLAPLSTRDLNQIEAEPPGEVFGIRRDPKPMPMIGFDLTDAAGWSALAHATPVRAESDQADQADDQADQPNQPDPPAVPIIVGRRFGFGKVTVVGIDLTSSAAINAIGGDEMYPLWSRVFGWRVSMSGRLIPAAQLDSPDASQLYHDPKSFISENRELGNWIGQRVARQAGTGLTLGLAIVLFLLYGGVTLLTFPAVLRGQGWDRHSWLIFVGIIAIFSGIAWGGATLLRPAKTSATHFSVLTIDGNRNLVHTQAWISLYVPSFADVQVAVPSENDGLLSQPIHNTLSSPGLSLQSEDPGYPDTQDYAFDAANPDRIGFPIRATTKPLVADFMGQITGTREGLDQPWSLPIAQVAMGTNGLPSGTVTHRFDQPLTDVVVVFCPGGAGRLSDDNWQPLVWEYRNANNQKSWEPNQPLTLPGSEQGSLRLWRPARLGGRDFMQEGHLGVAVNTRGPGEGGSGETDIVKDIALLSFFDAVPPPSFIKTNNSRYWTYHRSMLRDIDMTELTTGRRLIIIGHLRDSRLPMPLSVEGDAIPTQGWTVVRWVYDL